MNSTIYQMITDTILEHLEAGTVPWKQPWSIGNQAPRSLSTGRHYRGINVFLLASQGYASPYWLTFKQVNGLGGSIKKGQKSTPIIFWKWIQVQDDDPESETGKKEIPLLRYYRVWNLAQTTGIDGPEDAYPEIKNHTEEEQHRAAEEIISNYTSGPEIEEVGKSAWYESSEDRIVVPPRGTFSNLDGFYEAVFHEMGHSTSHPVRLDRIIDCSFGSHNYGREELVAEMTASFLCAKAGIQSIIPNSAAYLQNWMDAIREDNRAVIVAAAAAQHAADYILFDGNTE